MNRDGYFKYGVYFCFRDYGKNEVFKILVSFDMWRNFVYIEDWEDFDIKF